MTDTMAPPTPPELADPAEKGKKGKKGKKDKGDKQGKSNVLPAIILAVGIAAGGYFMGGSGGAEAAAPTTTEAPPAGELVTIEPMSVNLADGHYLRIGLALQLVEGVPAKDFQKKGSVSKIKDKVIARAGGAPIQTLQTAEGRETLKKELSEDARKLYEDEVLEVYLTEFVMQ